MRLDRLTVNGLFTFRQPAVLPASELPRGLIAIIGPIGAGKTALAECAIAAVHRVFPTREKDLVDYTNTREAYIDALYAINEDRYRLRVNLDGQTRKQQATVESKRIRDGRTDGKVSTFDAAIAEHFPSLPMLLATAFAAQNRRGSFSDLNVSQRKQLFQELLGLGEYETWSAAAGEIVRAIEKRLAALAPWLKRIQSEVTAEAKAALDAAITAKAEHLAALAEQLRTGAAAILEAEQAVARAEAAVVASEDRVRERVRLTQELTEARAGVSAIAAEQERAEREFADLGATRDRQYADARQRIEQRIAALPTDAALGLQLVDTLNAITARTQADVTDREGRRTNNQDVVNRRETITANHQEIERRETLRLALQESRAAKRREVEAREAEATQAQRRVLALAPWPERLAAARTSAALIDRVPFGPKCAEAGCEFVAQAVQARDAIPTAEAGVANHEHAKAASAEADRVLARERGALQVIDRETAENEQAIAALDRQRVRQDFAQLAIAAKRVEELDADIAAIRQRDAEDRATATAAHTERLQATQQARTAAQAELTALTEAHQEAITQYQTAHTERLQGITGRLTAASADVRNLEDQLTRLAGQTATDAATAAELATARAAEQTARQAQDTAARQHAAAIVEADQLGKAREAFAQREAEVARTAQAVEDLQRELVQWTFLHAATGRDGLPTLEIDAAGPIVSGVANDLLATCYGSQRFTVEIVTQTDRQKGGLKETMSMHVWDAKDMRRPRDIKDLSGGEKILVDEAIKCALALHVNDHHRTAIRTCFRDETTSSLDVHTALRYVAMLRRVLERGNFHQVFFISHSPACWPLADAQVHIDGETGQLSIHEPPYDDARLAEWALQTTE